MRELCYIYSRKRKNTGFPCQVFQWCKGQFNRSGEKDKTRPNSEFICFSWLAHSTVVLTYPFQNEMKIKSIHGPSFSGSMDLFSFCVIVLFVFILSFGTYQKLLLQATRHITQFCPRKQYIFVPNINI